MDDDRGNPGNDARNARREPVSLRAVRLRRARERAHRHYVSQLVIDSLSRDDRVGSFSLAEIVGGVADARAELAEAFGIESDQ